MLVALCAPQIAWTAAPPTVIELTAEERAWIAEHPRVRVGITPDWAPFSYQDDGGKCVGIDVEVLDFISEHTGLRFEIVLTESWEQTLKLVKTGDITFTASTAEMPERHETFVFTQPYFRSAVVIVAREGDRRFTHTTQLRHATIAMPEKHVTTIALRERLPGARIVLTDKQSDCFEMVRRKSADVAVANVFVTAHYLNKHPQARLSISGASPEAGFPLRFGVRKDSPILAGILDRALATLPQDTLDEIASRHLSFHLQSSSRISFLKQRAIEFFILLAAVGLVVLWRFWSLRNEVNARRKAEQQLRHVNHSLQVFSHAIAHDLKTPLRAIRGLTQIFCEDCRDSLNAVGKDYMNRIVAATDRMDQLLRDVLSYSKVSNSDASLTTVSLAEIVPQLIAELPPEQQGYVRIDGELPDVMANSTQLGQCIANLLSNAVKFVPKERTPDVRIWAAPSRDTVTLNVEDNGIGIAPEDQQRVFNLFQRVASQRTQTFEGTGIGLAVVARAMEKMGGHFGVESRLGEGSRFWIELPMPSSSAPNVTPSRRRYVSHWFRRKRFRC